MITTVTTSDGTEIVVRWKCPACRHEQDDTVHPELGPWGSCICGSCERTFQDEDLDTKSRDAWDKARDIAQLLSTEP